jgi:hypothetical protein
MVPRLSVADAVDDGLAASDPALGPYAPEPLAVLLHEPERNGAEGGPEALIGGLIGETA